MIATEYRQSECPTCGENFEVDPEGFFFEHVEGTDVQPCDN